MKPETALQVLLDELERITPEQRRDIICELESKVCRYCGELGDTTYCKCFE